jgi:hypothetical protein
VPIARLLLIAFIAGGCTTAAVSSSPSATSTVSIEPTATPEPTPKPPPTLKQLGRMYVSAAKPFNKRLCTWNTRFEGKYVTWDVQRDAQARLAPAYREWADRMREIPWTHEVRKEAEAVIRFAALEEATLRQIADIEDSATFYELLARYTKLNIKGSGAANVLRGALGIESVSGDACRT